MVDGGKLLGTYELVDLLLGVPLTVRCPFVAAGSRLIGDGGRGVGKAEGRGGCRP